MVRLAGTAFQGLTVYDCAPEAPTKRETLRKLAEDEAMIRDMVTGDNSPPYTLNHTGDAVSGQAGALLGVPCNQLHATEEVNHSLNSGATAGVNTYFAIVPWYKPPGETTLAVAFHGTPGFGYRLQVLDQSFNPLGDSNSYPFSESSDNGLATYFARATGLTADPNSGADQLWFVAVVGPALDASRSLHGLRFYYRLGGPAEMTVPARGVNLNRYTVPTVTSSGAEVADFEDIDSQHLGDSDADYVYSGTTPNATLEDHEHGFDARTLTLLSQNQNALQERITGAPCGNNEDYSLSDSGTTAPTQGAFLDGSLAGKSNEARFSFPLAMLSHGSIAADGFDTGAVDGATTKMHAPGLMSLNKTYSCLVPLHMPDFPDGASSRLRICALVCTPDENPGFVSTTLNWEPELWDETFSSSVSATYAESTFTRIGSTRFWFKEWTHPDFPVDAPAWFVDYWDASVIKDTDGGSFRVLGHAIAMVQT